MAGKKGCLPSHIVPPTFSHPGKDHPILQIFLSVKDPRMPTLFLVYPLTSVLFMTLVSTICGAKDWEQIAALSESLEEWLSDYVDMSGGVPYE